MLGVYFGGEAMAQPGAAVRVAVVRRDMVAAAGVAVGVDTVPLLGSSSAEFASEIWRVPVETGKVCGPQSKPHPQVLLAQGVRTTPAVFVSGKKL